MPQGQLYSSSLLARGEGIRLTPDAELAAVAGSVWVYSHPGPDRGPAVHARAHTHDGACKLVAQGNLEKF